MGCRRLLAVREDGHIRLQSHPGAGKALLPAEGFLGARAPISIGEMQAVSLAHQLSVPKGDVTSMGGEGYTLEQVRALHGELAG